MIDQMFTSAGPIAAVIVVLVAILEGYHYLKTRHQAQPAVPPATVAHVAALQNEIKGLANKVETSATVAAIKQRVEDLHARLDKREAEKGSK